MEKRIQPIKNFNRLLSVPPDKSITHRAVMLASIASGTSQISNPLFSDDCISTLNCMQKLGAEITVSGGRLVINGIGGAENLKSCNDLDCGNSGTTARLLSGILASASGKTFDITGDSSLKKRPMNRIITPLELMGAKIESGGTLPLKITGQTLKGINYKLPVASAQVKSCVLLAGLYSDGETVVTEDLPTRNHTELMLKTFGADIETTQTNITVKKSKLKAADIEVPGDISSAAFPLVLAAAKDGGSVTIKNVGTNSTRTGILKVLEKCGAKIEVFNARKAGYEDVSDITLNYSPLKPFALTKSDMPFLIDEIPVLAVLACFINGKSTITGAEELKVKESNRIDTVVNALKKMGADIKATAAGMIINGKGFLSGNGAVIETKGDHRIAMAMSVAAALSNSGASIKDAECASVSYPDFYNLFER